jgi:hypothetical protein
LRDVFALLPRGSSATNVHSRHTFFKSSEKPFTMPDKKKSSETDRADAAGKGQKQQTAADFDQTVREAEKDTKTRKPGSSGGNQSNQHNNGRGGGK